MPHKLSPFHKPVVSLALLALLQTCKPPNFDLVKIGPKLVIYTTLEASEPVDINTPFQDSLGYQVQLTDLAFYLSEVQLIGPSSSEYLGDVMLFNYDERDSEGAVAIFTRAASGALFPAEGSFTHLKFNVGLTPALNATDPTTMDNEHPLSSFYADMFWDWASQYRFIRFGAKRFINGDESEVQIHTGTESMFVGPIELPIEVELANFETDTIHFVVDWNKLFHRADSDSISLNQPLFTHGTGSAADVELAQRFTRNFARAIRLR